MVEIDWCVVGKGEDRGVVAWRGTVAMLLLLRTAFGTITATARDGMRWRGGGK